jgi:hypothetical protein
MMLYIEHPNGMAIDGVLAAEIREYVRSIWRGLYARGAAPSKWRDSSREVQDKYIRDMEKKWPVLCYCENHWKANTLVTSIYSQWYKRYHKKMVADAKENKLDDSEPVRKKARTAIEADDSSSSESESESDCNMDSLSSAPVPQDEETSDTRPSPNRQNRPSQGASRPRARPLRNPL